MINIDTIKDRFQLRFADEFFEELGREKGYEMMSLFECKRLPALENFIAKDYNGRIKLYIIWDNENQIIVGYFTLITTCMIVKMNEETNPEHIQEKDVEKIIPCVELEHFALNDIYLRWLEEHQYNNKGIGNFIYNKYIADIIASLSAEINFTYLILHAFNDLKVIDSYKRMGFETIEDDAESIVPVLSDVKALHSEYAGNCKFMFKDVETILREVERSD